MNLFTAPFYALSLFFAFGGIAFIVSELVAAFRRQK